MNLTAKSTDIAFNMFILNILSTALISKQIVNFISCNICRYMTFVTRTSIQSF